MNTAFAPTDRLHLTNLTKVFWPEHGYTKRDLLDYYRAVAPVMLPYPLCRITGTWQFNDCR
jgi:DNA primase